MTQHQNSTAKKRVFWVLTLAIPLILLFLIELSLRITGLGELEPLFNEVELNDKTYFSANREFANRYFSNTSITPTAANDVFLKEKPANGFRVFALGGSSMAGFPYHYNVMMSHVVKDVLEDGLPNHQVEVINLGISAVNTYTIYDMLPEVLSHEPDLILLYAGHNEYYGALGVGSSESLGSYPSLIRVYLKLQHFHSFNLLKKGITLFLKSILQKPSRSNATLMEQMVSDQQIALESQLFEVGQKQFQSNLEAIIDEISSQDVPLIIGDLISNIRDFEPFMAIESEEPNAKLLFNEGKAELEAGNFESGRNKLISAKDRDALRFRAPEATNQHIHTIAESKNLPVINVFDLFNERSEYGLTGNNLMLEHLHPNVEGYFYLGWIYAKKTAEWMQENDPAWQANQIKSESYYASNVAFSPFDKRVASYRLESILSGWPFQKAGINLPFMNKFSLNNLSDSLALKTYKGDANWQVSKEQLANTYVQEGKLSEALLELNGILRAYPWRVDLLEKKASICSDLGKIDEAISALKKASSQKATLFNTKILGALLLQTNRLEEGLPYLEAAFKINPKDPQNLYNLSGAYGIKKDFAQARKYLDKLLETAPNFPGAQSWKSQLDALTN